MYKRSPTSTCRTCEAVLPRDQFRLRSNGQIKESICRPCRAALIRRMRKTLPVRNRTNRRNRSREVYKLHKKRICEECGFKPLHQVQLDVDHVDGNFENNDPSNLKTLCANCHRLKSLVNRDGIYGYPNLSHFT